MVIANFVAFGDYPNEEGLHYEWENDYSLLDIERVEDLPTFRPEMIQPLFRYFDDLMYRNEYERIALTNLHNVKLDDVHIEEDEDYDLYNDSKQVKISDERVEEIVNSLTEGFYDSYEKMGSYWSGN